MWVAHFLARNKSNRRVEVVRNTRYFQRTREKKIQIQYLKHTISHLTNSKSFTNQVPNNNIIYIILIEI